VQRRACQERAGPETDFSDAEWLAHLGQPAWAALMAKIRRKTLIVCSGCHDYIHATPVANAA
jgi:hypothetical protein